MTKPVQPIRNIDFNEGTTTFLETTHLNKDKVLAAPTTLQYRIDDITNNREVLDYTNVSTPGTTNTIEITAAQNALNGRAQGRELRQVTVKATDSAGSIVQDVFYYTLIRIFDRTDQIT